MVGLNDPKGLSQPKQPCLALTGHSQPELKSNNISQAKEAAKGCSSQLQLSRSSPTSGTQPRLPTHPRGRGGWEPPGLGSSHAIGLSYRREEEEEEQEGLHGQGSALGAEASSSAGGGRRL